MHVKKLFFLRMFFVYLLIFVVLIQVSPISYAMIDNEYFNNSPSNVDSETDADTVNSDSASVSVGIWEYIKVLLALVFVIGILIFVLRFLNKRNRKYQQNSMIRNIGGHSVGSQKSVQLLHIGNRIYIVGVGEDVQLLQVISDSQEIEQMMALYNEKYGNTSTTPYVAELFAKFKTKRSATIKSEDFSDILDKRLSEIKQERSDELVRWKEKENDKR